MLFGPEPLQAALSPTGPQSHKSRSPLGKTSENVTDRRRTPQSPAEASKRLLQNPTERGCPSDGGQNRVELSFCVVPCFTAFGLRTLSPVTAFKNGPNPKFVQTFSRRLCLGFPIKRTRICQKFVESGNCRFQLLDKLLTDWNPKKESSGQILDKSGVRGIFECCKGREGLQYFGVPRYPCRYREKQHEKRHCHTPLCVPPQNASKN